MLLTVAGELEEEGNEILMAEYPHRRARAVFVVVHSRTFHSGVEVRPFHETCSAKT